MVLTDKVFYSNTEQKVACVQQTFSSETESTVPKAIAMLEWLQTRWEEMAEDTRYQALAPAIKAGLSNLRKWYRALDASDAYVICQSTLALLSFGW
jgi:hypothetical protein